MASLTYLLLSSGIHQDTPKQDINGHCKILTTIMKIAQKSDETPYVHVNHTTFIVHHLQTLRT